MLGDPVHSSTERLKLDMPGPQFSGNLSSDIYLSGSEIFVSMAAWDRV